jgi:hypothetical protein
MPQRKDKAPAAMLLGLLVFCVGRHVAKGSTRHKKSPPGDKPPEGGFAHAPPGTIPIRRAYVYGGVSIAALLFKGLCHTDRPTRKPWGFTLIANLYIRRAANFCQEDPPESQTASPDAVRRVTLAEGPAESAPPPCRHERALVRGGVTVGADGAIPPVTGREAPSALLHGLTPLRRD